MIEHKLTDGTFEYRVHSRKDMGFLGFDVTDENHESIVDVGIQLQSDGRVSIAIFQNDEEKFLRSFEPTFDTRRFHKMYQKQMERLSELPPNLQAPIEDHPEVDVLIGHVHHGEVIYDDLERLDRLEEMVSAAELFRRATR